jgi:endoglucanase
MTGFGPSYPTQIHHRGASIISIHDYSTRIGCGEGFFRYFGRSDANPNILTGAIVGGPNFNDDFHDSRRESDYTEPTTYINSGFVGLLARLLRQFGN